MSIHFHKLKIKDVRRETADCISVAFDVPEELKTVFRFKQGQNITIREILEKEELRRSYSICSSPLENELRIAIKHTEGGKFSSWANQSLKKGQELDVLPPTGKFYTEVDSAHKKDYLAFAAGSGITPVLSIIQTILSTEKDSRFTLVYGNKNRSSIIFKEQLEAIKNRYIERFSVHHILSREKMDADVNYGRINEEKLEQLGNKLIDLPNTDEIFICGPEQMIFTVRDWLLKKDVAQTKIHFELFTVPGEQQKSSSTKPRDAARVAEEKAAVTVRVDGVSFDFDLEFDSYSVLDAAMKQGADLPFSCKGGVCSTCKAKVVEGAVEMDTNYALEPEEVEAGFILTCQSHPRSSRLIVDFDAR